MDPANSDTPTCVKCGHRGYDKIRVKGGSYEWRCFPHAVPHKRFLSNRWENQLAKAEERYALEHIDCGFPEGEGKYGVERVNQLRETAWGSKLRPATGPQRAGLVR